MVDKIEDLNLPNAVVARLIKGALPEGAAIGKEARAALARAASVFVIYLTQAASKIAMQENHKTLTTKNIFDALDEIEFENFVEPLTEALNVYRKSVKDKKDTKEKNAEIKKKDDNTSELEAKETIEIDSD